jgi:hypothetical protein
MHRFFFLVISVTIIAGIIFIAKTTGNPLDINSSDFYLNLLTEIIGITVSVVLIEIFGTKILKYLELKKNKSYNEYLNKRLDILIGRFKEKYAMLSIDMGSDFETIEEFTESLNLEYINGTQTVGHFINGRNESRTIQRPILFFTGFTSLVKELEQLSSQLPQGLPNEIYEGILMLLSQDNYMWNHFGNRNWNYNQGWIDVFKGLLFDKYSGLKKLIDGKKQLEKMIE